MPSDNDWVSRDLQRLAKESKLLRKPTEAEWQRIWRAATDWADAVGVITMSMSIEPFVRENAPGVLREPGTARSNPNPPVTTPAENAPTAQKAGNVPAPASPSALAENPDRARRSPRTSERSKPSGKPAAN